MNIAITGADGFIGSHLVERLAKKHNVLAITYYNSFGNLGWLENSNARFKVMSGDINDPFFLEKVFKGIDIVFNLAALIAIPYSYKAPYSYFLTNGMGTLNVLNAARINKVKKVIHTSTSEVYGNAKEFPITENALVTGNSPYSASKIAADQIAISFHKSFNFPVTIIRPFNTFGPRQSLRAVIPTIITQSLSNKKEIFLGELSAKRNFNYISDTINGFEKCINTKDDIGEIINIGSNFEISIKDLANMILKILGSKAKIKIDKKRIRPKKSEVFRLVASNKKALKYLNWQPKVKDKRSFQDCLKNLIEWYKDKNNLKHFKINKYNI